jgi:hypothetical protein
MQCGSTALDEAVEVDIHNGVAYNHIVSCEILVDGQYRVHSDDLVLVRECFLPRQRELFPCLSSSAHFVSSLLVSLLVLSPTRVPVAVNQMILCPPLPEMACIPLQGVLADKSRLTPVLSRGFALLS